MRLLVLYLAVVLFALVASQGYVPSREDPNVLVPVIVDRNRPRIRIKQVLVEEAPSNKRIYELLYLIFAVPFLFLGSGRLFNRNGNGNGNGNGGGVITENPCCG